MKTVKMGVEGVNKELSFESHLATLIGANEELNHGASEHYRALKLTYVDVPEIVGITGACENVDTLFKVQNRFDLPLFFSQTGQLSLEQSLQVYPGVYTVIHSGRDEELEDERHLRQFRLTEEEFDCSYAGMEVDKYDEEKMFEALLSRIQGSIQAMIKKVLENGKKLKTEYGRTVSRLKYSSENNFLRIEYEAAVKLLNENGFTKIKFGDDLKSEHEAKIVELLNKKGEELPVFIMKYPKAIKFFNMKVSTADPRVVLSADLILPYAGEAVGSAVREHDYRKLKERLLTSNMYRLHKLRGGKLQDFAWYLKIVRSKKSRPHAGYGIGNDRVMQYIFGTNDIRAVSLFAQLNAQTKDWDRKKYGQSVILVADKKHLLLSIGKKSDKQFLLPYIQKLSKNRKYVLHATSGTHQFLQEHRVDSSLVYKISEVGQAPNIADLMGRRVFDIVINIPMTAELKTGIGFTDGKLIRKGATNLGVYLVTSTDVAGMLVDRLLRSEG